jgi:hypothetical protein
MKPWRKVYRNIFENEGLGILKSEAFQLFTAFIVYADDEGRCKAGAAYLRGKAFRYRDDVTVGHVKALRDALAAGGFLTLYRVDGEDYALLKNWEKWQGEKGGRSNRFTPSELPKPPKNKDFPNDGRPLAGQWPTTGRPLDGLEEIRGEKRRGEGEASVDIFKDNNIEKDKNKSDAAPARPGGEPPPPLPVPVSSAAPAGAGPAELPAGHYPEADILAVAAAYVEARCIHLADQAARDAFMKRHKVYYGAKDLLTLAQGNVERAVTAINQLAKYYADEQKENWNLNWIVDEDYSKWDKERSEHEKKQNVSAGQ